MSKLNTKSLQLTGSEIEARLNGWNCDIRNDGTDTIYASGEPNIVAGADGVMSIPAGQAAKLLGCCGKVYLLGTGGVQLCGNDVPELVFKTAATTTGGGGTEDNVARNAINNHARNTDIHLTADDIAGLASNPNLLINPDFAINQRSVSGTITDVGYFVDRWQLVSGSVTRNTDGTLTLNGIIKQVLEKAAGNNTTASASAGTASYDNATKTFTLTANGETISWAKLECGGISTRFSPPDSATELAKCQRYAMQISKGVQATVYRVLTNVISFYYPLPCNLRALPISTAIFKVYTGNNIVQEDFSFNYYLKPNGIIIEAVKQAHGIIITNNPILVCEESGIFEAELT